MRKWNDGKNIYNHLAAADIDTIEDVCFFFFRIKFGKMSEFDRSAILMRCNDMHDATGPEVLDFIQWLHDRGIPFKLRWRPNSPMKRYWPKEWWYIQNMKFTKLRADIQRWWRKNVLP